jgi:hypothetical protein
MLHSGVWRQTCTFYGSVYPYENLNYVNGCVVRILLEAKPIKVLSETTFLLKLNSYLYTNV